MGINSKTTEDTFLEHARKQPWWQDDIANKSNSEVKRILSTRPVCPRCEKIAFRDTSYREEGHSTCPSCGWSGKTIELKDVIEEKLYR